MGPAQTSRRMFKLEEKVIVNHRKVQRSPTRKLLCFYKNKTISSFLLNQYRLYLRTFKNKFQVISLSFRSKQELETGKLRIGSLTKWRPNDLTSNAILKQCVHQMKNVPNCSNKIPFRKTAQNDIPLAIYLIKVLIAC